MAEPVAESALAGVGVVAMFVPYVSQALIALNALEVAVGYRLDPFPGIPQIVMDITSAGTPERGPCGTWERRLRLTNESSMACSSPS